MKRFKNLHALGCSFVAGDGMDEREKIKFPDEDGSEKHKYECRFSKLLSDKLELKEINNSVGGFSNHRIYRTAYDWITNQPPQTIKETLFIIGITDISRTDLQLDDGVIRLPGILGDMNCIHDNEREVITKITTMGGLEVDDFFDYWTKWFKYIYSEDIRLEETMRDYHLLQTLIKSLGGDVIFFNTVRMNNPIYNYKHRVIPSDVHLDSRLQWFKPLGKYDGWREFIITFDSDYTGEHPSVKDHAILSEELYTHIIKNYE